MNPHFDVFQPNLLKTLEDDILKFQRYGPPVFQLNIPCRHKEHCKYGRYSCNYSHTSFCKFQKNGKKCLNMHCTHSHELPLEYQLAQALFTKKMQFSKDPSSSEAQNSASQCHFSSNSLSQSGTSVHSVFRFKTNDHTVKSHENNPKNNAFNSLQPQNKAETHLTAFSSIFQHSAKQSTFSPGKPQASTKTKPTQIPSKSGTNTTPINFLNPSSAPLSIKTSEIQQKAAHQFQALPPRIIASNQLPPPVNQPQKAQFQPQIKHPTCANLILATSSTPLQRSSPGFTSKNPNSPHNSLEEIKFAAFPAAPAPAFLYDVVSIANVRDYKDTVCGATGNAADRPDLSLPSMETNSSSPSQRPAPGTPSKPAIITKTVDDPIISLISEQKAMTISAKIKTQDTEQQIQLKREQRALKKSQAQHEYLRIQSLPIEEKSFEEFKKKHFDIAKFHGTDALNEEQLRIHHNKALQRQKQHEQVDEKEKHEIRQELEKLLLTNPKLETDLNLEEQRFYYKIFNHHLSEEQIELKSSEEMLAFLGNKIEASKKTELSSETSLSDDEISPLDKLNFRPPREEPHSPTDYLPTQMDTIYDSDECNSENDLCDYDTDESYISDLMISTQQSAERPIYLLPPEICKMHFYYYASDYPNYTHLQVICAFFSRKPVNSKVIASLQYYEYQKSHLIQRGQLPNRNIRNLQFIHKDIITFADSYHDYNPNQQTR